jgi:hypothetical protein
MAGSANLRNLRRTTPRWADMSSRP